MNIWLGATTAEWEKYHKHYLEIRETLLKLGCIINHDWLPYAAEVYEKQIKYSRGPEVYKSVTEAIKTADAVIIEHTVPNFSTAHQINFALQRQKPTLVLRLHKENTIFADSYLESLNHPLLTVKEYTELTHTQILKEFLKLTEMETSLQRYNVVLNRQQKYYLDWKSQTASTSRSETIRKALDKLIEEDHDYSKYIQS